MPQSAKIADLIVGDVISFNTYGVGTINNVLNGRLKGTIAGDSLRNPQAAAANHAAIYSSIPPNPANPVPNDYTAYTYLVIQLSDNSLIEIGEPWIVEVSLTRLVRQVMTITLIDTDSSQIQAVSDLLTSGGFLGASIVMS